MAKFRTHGPDVHHDMATKVIKPTNQPPAGRIGVYNSKGQLHGHIGPHGGAGVASRLVGGAPVEIGKVKGKHAWISTGPSRPSSNQKSMMKLRSQLRGDKGSNR
jgi:hypothetical protein